MTNHESQITVGVLALQGDFAEHITILDRMEIRNIEIRNTKELSEVDALIIPGGESTVMWKFLRDAGLDTAIKKRVEAGMPVLGTCAGAILLSDSHLGLLDISVDRNAYGSQLQSFSDQIQVDSVGLLDAVFIRAPIITRIGQKVEVLAMHRDNPVLIRQGNIMASTFHPEISSELAIHSSFIKSCISV